MTLAQLLLDWYDGNKRNLPWRENNDPYRVWVSEAMLQQTRVEAVKAYYERWMDKYPTMDSLAAATEDDVLHLWQGLGYYTRVRNLLEGVREVAGRYDGTVPDTREEIQKITGIGEYMAGAILSIAYGKKESAVDGNVLRVFARLYCIESDIARAPAKKSIARLVERDMDPERPGDFNQAVMDLGALICIPRSPRCGRCPVAGICLAFQRGCQKELPVRKKRAAVKTVYLAAGILQQAGRYLLRKRPQPGLLGGLWEFPAIEVGQDADPELAVADMFGRDFNQVVKVEERLLQTMHGFSHQNWNISFYRCEVRQSGSYQGSAIINWAPVSEWAQIAFAGPHKKAAELLVKTDELTVGQLSFL